MEKEEFEQKIMDILIEAGQVKKGIQVKKTSIFMEVGQLLEVVIEYYVK